MQLAALPSARIADRLLFVITSGEILRDRGGTRQYIGGDRKPIGMQEAEALEHTGFQSIAPQAEQSMRITYDSSSLY